ncbi:hypothetical protein M3Y97_00943300 [Aphelenchoides bicaudatus]|nr:hypothetical protein M3Y97_00943300 [Aphelenchoides bicaudatus]
MSEEPKRKRKKVASNIEVLESESSMETESGHTSNNQAPSLNYEELAKAERFKNTGAVLEMDAKDFTMEYVRRSKLKQPILFTGQLKQLGMRIPKLNTRQIVQKLSDGFSCFVTNDKTHQTTTMPIKDFVYDKFNRFSKHNRSEVLQMSRATVRGDGCNKRFSLKSQRHWQTRKNNLLVNARKFWPLKPRPAGRVDERLFDTGDNVCY